MEVSAMIKALGYAAKHGGLKSEVQHRSL